MRSCAFILIASLMMLGSPRPLIAQPSQPAGNLINRSSNVATPAAVEQPSNPLGMDVGRVALSLAGVLALILVLRFLIRRISPNAMGRSSRGIRVITRAYLAPKQQVVVLQVGRRILVVGDSGQHLSTLCEITDPDEAAMLLAQISGKLSDSDQSSFADAMSRASAPLSSLAGDHQNNPALETARTELNGLSQRIRTLSKHLNRA